MKFLFFFLVFVIGVVSVISDDDFHRIGVNEPEVKSAVKWLMNKTKFGNKFIFLNTNKALVKNTKEGKIYKLNLKVEESPCVVICNYTCDVEIHKNKNGYSNRPETCKAAKIY